MGDRVLLCPNPYRDVDLDVTLYVQDLLEKHGYKTYICPIFDEVEDSAIPENIEKHRLRDVIDEAFFVVAIGGDGTILHCGKCAAIHKVPVIGINAGTKGFMAILEKSNADQVLRAVSGDYLEERRMMLDVSLIRDGEIIMENSAINDIVVNGFGDCIGLTAWCDGDKMTKYFGDGAVFATPTGSSAYSLSAGGPLVEPTAQDIIFTPICVHGMSAKSFVLSPDRILSARAECHYGKQAFMKVDGSDLIELENDDIKKNKKSNLELIMANLGQKSFYDIAFEKLIEGY